MRAHFFLLPFVFLVSVMAVLAVVPCAAQDISEDTLVNPSARDILDRIEGLTYAPAPKVVGDSAVLSLSFASSETALSELQKQDIEQGLESLLDSRGQARVQIISYATSSNDGLVSARRVSLERAITVREFLKERGLSARRIDIFPMGEQTPPPVQDKVELYISD